MRREVNLMTRGIGDCRIAGPEYSLRLETTSEAQKIANLVHKKFKLVVKPRIIIKRRSCRRLNGKANHHTGDITLYYNGANVGVLLHELAHLDRTAAKICETTGNKFKYTYRGYRRVKRDVHGLAFKTAQTAIIRYWRSELESKFNITSAAKVTQNPEPYKYVGRITLGPKKEVVVEDTEEENRDFIHGLMDNLSKYAVYETLSINSIVRCLWVNGVKNTDENRKIAVDYVKDKLNLKVISFK